MDEQPVNETLCVLLDGGQQDVPIKIKMGLNCAFLCESLSGLLGEKKLEFRVGRGSTGEPFFRSFPPEATISRDAGKEDDKAPTYPGLWFQDGTVLFQDTKDMMWQLVKPYTARVMYSLGKKKALNKPAIRASLK